MVEKMERPQTLMPHQEGMVDGEMRAFFTVKLNGVVYSMHHSTKSWDLDTAVPPDELPQVFRDFIAEVGEWAGWAAELQIEQMESGGARG